MSVVDRGAVDDSARRHALAERERFCCSDAEAAIIEDGAAIVRRLPRRLPGVVIQQAGRGADQGPIVAHIPDQCERAAAIQERKISRVAFS